ncbi:hypothetical protein CS060_09695 [Anoxybacillus flavithermus]|uniref:FAD/NAD(P)-binding domain-containing protein n=1 Tax=Anoxybacillus flavithermus TaxID=33934 RepID=A0A2G5RNJ8_9BACL|nr:MULTISPECIES: FAD-dependent oxidoreductase [Anoxybacillus]KFZ43025.1 hypothetical protein JS80_06330 [Anoxybacillus sp. KU2-6(11)]PIC04418.1 hypothetical protein CS060_09695 [Anoxybacillus flavithermus]
MTTVKFNYLSDNNLTPKRINWDLAIIGGGFRTTTFLASAPELLKYRITIVERGNVIGPGAFSDYTITTSSTGSSLFKALSYHGSFAVLRNNSKVTSVAKCQNPIRTEDLSTALLEVGSVISDKLGDTAIRLNSNVNKIELDSDKGPVTLHINGGDIIHARHVILATGRRERPHVELEAWRDKVMLSSSVISLSKRKLLENKILSLGGRPIVIVGCSHSAMSALQILLEVTNQLERYHSEYRRPPIFVIQRSLARLMYENQEQARKEQVLGREQLFDPNQDICPDTGIVFRDSGLRHKSKELYCNLWSGKIPNAHIVRVKVIREASDLLDSSGLVVQALGYKGEAPDILVSGKLVRPSSSNERLWADEDGAALIGGHRYENLSILRIEPTPPHRKDNSAYGKNLYRLLSSRLEHLLSESIESEANL